MLYSLKFWPSGWNFNPKPTRTRGSNPNAKPTRRSNLNSIHKSNPNPDPNRQVYPNPTRTRPNFIFNSDQKRRISQKFHTKAIFQIPGSNCVEYSIKYFWIGSKLSFGAFHSMNARRSLQVIFLTVGAFGTSRIPISSVDPIESTSVAATQA